MAAEIEEEIVAEAVRRSLQTADTAESGVVGTRTIYVDRPARGERIFR